MAHDFNPSPADDFGSLAIINLLPERPALIGEFSLAYEAFREATIADLGPVTKYEYLQALQLADLGHPAGEGICGGRTLHRHGAHNSGADQCQT